MGARFLPIAAFAALIGLAAAGSAQAQIPQRPPVGGFGSPADAMIFYVAHGAPGACGEGCSDWIAAEGTIQWDTHKRLIAILDRNAGHKYPVVIHAWGTSNLNVAVSLGRILHGRGVDTMAGTTEVGACNGKTRADCFALKRPGGPLDARLNVTAQSCDLGCVLMLVGGIHRSLPAGTRVLLGGMAIHNRLAPNVSEERREGLTTLFGEQFRVYLREMDVQTELLDTVDKNSEAHRETEVPASDWQRLGIVTAASREGKTDSAERLEQAEIAQFASQRFGQFGDPCPGRAEI
jgi:hypothetical protein